MYNSKIIISLAVLCCFQLTFLSAQIVNIENKRVHRTDTIGWFGSINLGLNLVENGKTVLTTRAAANLERRHHRHLLLSFTKYNLGRIEDEPFINDGFQHLRYNYQFNDRITWEAFTQVQYNERIKLHLRWLLGTGPRYQFLRKEKFKSFVGALYMYEYNEETINAELENFNYLRDHRLSAYLSFYLKPLDNLQITSITYFQPVITDPDDLRLSSDSSIAVNITKKLLLTMRFSIVYDSRVPDEVPNTIYSLVNGLRWNF